MTWPEYTIAWRHGASRYVIIVRNPDHRCTGVAWATLDGEPVDASSIPLTDDGSSHEVVVVIGPPSTPPGPVEPADPTRADVNSHDGVAAARSGESRG
jgi:hypothetical protein